MSKASSQQTNIFRQDMWLSVFFDLPRYRCTLPGQATFDIYISAAIG